MDVYLDSIREPRDIDESCPRYQGGEAILYELPDLPGQLAKIYRNPTEKRQEKAQAMMANPPPTTSVGGGYAQIVWPQGLIWKDSTRQDFLGIEIPLVPGMHPLNTLWPGGTSARSASFGDLVFAARNIAWGVATLHDAGYVIVDLAPGNILVGPNMLVAFIDTDSYEFRAHDTLYPGRHGRPIYTSPEILNAAEAEGIERRPEHDLFGLATLVFQLLTGIHPFTARHTGSGNKLSMEDRIKMGIWPYAKRRSPGYLPSPSAPSYRILHRQLRQLMQEAFEQGHNDPSKRPPATRWREALDRVLRNRWYLWKSQWFRCVPGGADTTLLIPRRVRAAWRQAVRFVRPEPRWLWQLGGAAIAVTTAAFIALNTTGGYRHPTIRKQPTYRNMRTLSPPTLPRPTTVRTSRSWSYDKDVYGNGKPTPRLWLKLAEEP